MMIKTLAYHADNLLGEVEIFPTCTQTELMMMSMREKGGIRINQFSQPSDRCTPLAVLHTISSTGVCFKMEEPYKPSSSSFTGCPETPLFALHSACLREKKTAVMSLGEEELHLVAMRSRRYDGKTPCFWGYIVPVGLYKHCLIMLNLRCLGIVFDLDETLIVANTMRSFEDRIDALQRKINLEVDQQRIAGMMAEVKRYQDDKTILKQYAENDQVTENGKVLRVQSEAVPALSDSHQPVVRPIIRLQDKNIVLTRINPLIRDTSVLVKLRPAWEELRSYLIAKGRKRFEVYVCTMAERDYALEMWRLLDPDSNLINSNELLNRIVCVKSGLKKSLFNVFHDGICHPKMALVIDDRLKVWDERDQPRVHVVPAFAPYYAPQAEANNTIPVLCVARNVACSVRGSFFKEFDDGLLQRISDVLYEDDHRDIPSTPDVSNYLVPQDDPGTKEMLSHDGMADAEVERRLKEALSASSVIPLSAHPTVANLDQRLVSSPQFPVSSPQFPISPPITVTQPAPQGPMMPFVTNPFPQASPLIRPLGPIGAVDLNLQSSPAREEGEVPESELDPDTRRRLLILQHGLDIRDQSPSEPQFPVRPPVPAPVPVPVPVPAPIAHAPSRGNWFSREDQMSPGQLNRTPPKEFPLASESMSVEKQRPPPPPPFMRKMENNIRPERTFFPKQRFVREVPRRDDVLRSNYSPHSDHSFRGEDITSGRSFSGNKDFEAQPVRSSFSFKDNESEPCRSSSSNKDLETEPGKGTLYSETPAGALHDIAMKCGTKVEFKHAMVSVIELKFSVEVYFAGEGVGAGTGKTRREAKHKASEAALMNLAEKYFTHLKSDPSLAEGDVNKALNADDNVFASDSSLHGNQASMGEESGSPRSFQTMPNKRFKPDFTRVLHRLPSSRYPKNASPVP